jgi:hypothetical protein
MNRSKTLMTMAAALLMAGGVAQADDQHQDMARHSQKLRGTVTAVDMDARLVTLRLDAGTPGTTATSTTSTTTTTSESTTGANQTQGMTTTTTTGAASDTVSLSVLKGDMLRGYNVGDRVEVKCHGTNGNEGTGTNMSKPSQTVQDQSVPSPFAACTSVTSLKHIH